MAEVQNHWVEPPDNIGLTKGVVIGDTTIPMWELGTTHLLEWTTPWEFFNLFLVQDNPPNYEDVILTNVTNITSFNWTVATDIIDLDISRTCWFKLHTIASEGDTFFESAAFNISGGPSWPASDLVSSTVLPTTSLTSMATSIPTLAPVLTSTSTPALTSSTPFPSTLSAPIPASTDLPSTNPSITPSHPASPLILEIALGVSIPVLLVLGLLIGWKIRNKRKLSLPRKPADTPSTEIVAPNENFNVLEKEASEVHELFSPVWRSELDDDARWEMSA
ncbi:hypothetical protein MMC11_004459 [Xylographa trunciseda]|nr:hypothetical protein [Xylographa trunciseda]